MTLTTFLSIIGWSMIAALGVTAGAFFMVLVYRSRRP